MEKFWSDCTVSYEDFWGGYMTMLYQNPYNYEPYSANFTMCKWKNLSTHYIEGIQTLICKTLKSMCYKL